ncbi:MAG: hypothetical protein K9N23_20765 [Akkermansiaceae bacterium]|nr:hypothetical protein [Akkermansiaceae bacterium]
MCVDTNGDGGAASASDRGFLVNQDGVPLQMVGSGGTMINDETPGLGFTAEARIGGSAWCAEFRINESLLGGWNHATRFSFSLKQATWPATANKNDPATWSTAWLRTELPAQANHAPYRMPVPIS